jgi:tol-pal system protein YbgF
MVRLGFALFLLVVSGCVSTSDFDAMKADINQLRRDSNELKKSVTALKEHTSGAVKEDSFNAIRESQASLYSQVAEQSKEVQVLQGRFDENKFFIDKALKESSIERELLRSQISSLEKRVKELNDRITRLSEPGAFTVQKPSAEGEDSSEKGVPEKSPDDEPAKAYEAAYTLLKEKQFKEAREKFSAFIKRFPKDGLAGNAQFWIGESYYAEKDFESAILAYEALIKNYSQNEKIPGALLKQGLAFAELGDKKTAKVILDKLIEKYPDSREAGLAKKKKTELDKKPVKPQKNR